MKKRILKITIKVLISGFFLGFVVHQTDWPEVLFYLKKIKLWQILLYVVILISGMAVSAYKWQQLAEFKKINRPFSDYFKLYLTGTFINNFMPSFVAGDAYKAYEIAKPDKSFGQAASSVMMDRITGLVGAMVLALLCSLVNFKEVINNNYLILINCLIILSLSIDLIIAKMRQIVWLKKIAFHFLPEKAIDFLRDLYSYTDNKRLFRQSVFWGIIFSVVGVAILNYVLFWGLDIAISPIDYLSVIFLISIVSALPISINNIGLKEWAYMTFFGFFGVTSGAVIAVSVISRFLQMFISFAALPAYLRSRK